MSSSMNCAPPSSWVPKVSCVFLPVVEVEPEQLLVAADARDVDEGLAVGRPGRRVVGEVVLGEVDDLLGLEIDREDVARCRRAAPRRRSACRRARSRATRARRPSSSARAFRSCAVSTFCRSASGPSRCARSRRGDRPSATTTSTARVPAPAGRDEVTRSPCPCRSPWSGCGSTWPSLRRDQHDVELAILAGCRSSRRSGRPTATARSTARCVKCGSSRVRRQVAAVVGRPLLVAERLEALLQVAVELLVELVRLIWNASS